jgi:hypothetical protein
MKNFEEGFDAFKQVPRTEGVDTAPDWMQNHQEGVDVAPDWMNKKTYDMYVGAEPDEEGAFDPLWDKGKTRREISDQDAEFIKNPSYHYGELGDLLQLDEVYKKYPDVAKIATFSLSPTEQSMGDASYAEKMNRAYGEEGIEYRPKMMTDTVKRNLLHEVQHAIQKREGWARGGNPEQFRVTEEQLKRQESELEAIEQAKLLKEKLAEGMSLGDAKSWLISQGVIKEIHPYAGQYAKFFNASQLKDHENKTLESLNKSPTSGFEEYQNLAGEVEARDTASRMNLTPEQRMSELPYKSQGIPLKKIIARRTGGTMASVDQKKFDAFVDKALSDNKVQEVMAGGNLTPRQIGDIQKILRIAAEGFFREFRSNDMRHAIQKHGKDKLPVTSADLKGIPSLLNSYDYMKKGTQDALGIPSVKYIKKISNGKTTYVERINPRKKKASNKTMWKEPRGVR